MTDNEIITHKIEIWKKVIDVQQHFNDLEMRIRNFAISILGALFGAVGVTLSQRIEVTFSGEKFPVGLALLFAALVIWAAFYFMDKHWYHRLLYGAVKQGQVIEDSIASTLPEISLTTAIGDESPFTFLGEKVRSPQKIDTFYFAGFFAIFIAITGLLAVVKLEYAALPLWVTIFFLGLAIPFSGTQRASALFIVTLVAILSSVPPERLF